MTTVCSKCEIICELAEGDMICCICYEVEPNQMCDECYQDWKISYDNRISYAEIDNLRGTI